MSLAEFCHDSLAACRVQHGAARTAEFPRSRTRSVAKYVETPVSMHVLDQLMQSGLHVAYIAMRTCCNGSKQAEL